jgi:hypothetical protein
MGTGGWVLEKARRFKSNGRVLGVSPLNDLIEREGLLLSVCTAKPPASAHCASSPTPTPDSRPPISMS